MRCFWEQSGGSSLHFLNAVLMFRYFVGPYNLSIFKMRTDKAFIEVRKGFLVQVFKCMSDQSHCTVILIDLYLNMSGKYQHVVYSDSYVFHFCRLGNFV